MIMARSIIFVFLAEYFILYTLLSLVYFLLYTTKFDAIEIVQ